MNPLWLILTVLIGVLILWKVTKIVAKVLLICLLLYILYMVGFVWTLPHYHQYFCIESFVSEETHLQIHQWLSHWDTLRQEKGLLHEFMWIIE